MLSVVFTSMYHGPWCRDVTHNLPLLLLLLLLLLRDSKVAYTSGGGGPQARKRLLIKPGSAQQ